MGDRWRAWWRGYRAQWAEVGAAWRRLVEVTRESWREIRRG